MGRRARKAKQMNRVAVKQKLLPAASGPVLARLIPADEFNDLTDLRVEYGRRLNELLAVREEVEALTREKRRAQDIAVRNHQTAEEFAQQAKSLRCSLILAERKLADAKAFAEGIDSQIRTALLSWLTHDEECEDGCVAAAEIPRDFALMFEDDEDTNAPAFGGADTVVPAARLLRIAIEDRDEDLVQLAATALAATIHNGPSLRWWRCGCAVAECSPCNEHETCNPKTKTCAHCLHGERHGARADMAYDARKGGAR